ncbi:MAG: hypothetical protein JNL52_15285 [Flavobacteriales bacterium]|nr:hypothetical protein [Flavobacteriales bacterium]
MSAAVNTRAASFLSRSIVRVRSAWVAFGLFVPALVLAQPSPPSIGFADTLLFNDSLRYTGFGYDGPAPLFVQAWFPLGSSIADTAGRLGANILRFHELRKPTLPPALQPVHQQLVLHMDSAFIEYDLRYPVNGDGPIDYAPLTEWQVKDSLFSLGTHAHRAAFPARVDRPVVVYHHGSQGLSDENVWMAEYFAENGFLFLSCNFHWPLEGRSYGFPVVWTPDHSSIRTMLQFARRLNGGNKVFFIGHSWGAQEGWCTLHEPGLADAFISLETTMEWKTDTAEVRDKWPFVLHAITTHSYPLPILMVADTEGEPPFPMFKGVRGDVRYLDPKEPFNHESYTSAYLLRQAGQGRFPVPDKEDLHQQAELYAALLKELLAFLQKHAGLPVVGPRYPDGDVFHRH